MNPEIIDGTLGSLVMVLGPFWTPDNSRGWNDAPVYVECDDGVVRRLTMIGYRVVPHGHKSEEFVYDGGFYLKAEI